MTKKEIQECRESLELMRTDELVDIIIEQSQKLTLYEEKEMQQYRNDKHQGRLKPDNWE
jgi:hypothetical protein